MTTPRRMRRRAKAITNPLAGGRKVPKPSARAFEHASPNARFKRTVTAPVPRSMPVKDGSAMVARANAAARPKPTTAAATAPKPNVRAPGQLKKLAGAKSARAFAPGQLKKATPGTPPPAAPRVGKAKMPKPPKPGRFGKGS
jgi:hypothetical protein